MKSLLQTFALVSALLLAPAFVFAQDTAATTNTSAEATATVKPPRPPEVKPRPLVLPTPQKIREMATSSRPAAVRSVLGERMASSTLKVHEELRLKLETKREEARVKVEAAKEKARQKFGEAVQTSVGNIVDRLTKAIERLTTLASRVETRITELETTGADMSFSTELLVTARTNIATAQDKATAVGVALTAALSSSKPKEQMQTVRAAVKAAEDALKIAKQSLQDTLGQVRADASVSATTN